MPFQFVTSSSLSLKLLIMASPVSDSPIFDTAALPVAMQQSRHVQSTSIVSREIAGDTIVVPICRGVGDLDSVYTFNALGTHLWRLLEQGRTELELVAWVTMHFAVSENQALEDVRNFLADLQAVRLIQSA